MKILTIILLFISTQLGATKYYVATTGSNSDAGTIAAPFLTWQKGYDVAVAGDTVYIRGGTYRYSMVSKTIGQFLDCEGRNGSAGNYINIWNYPGETPILNGDDFTSTGTCRGIYLGAVEYIYLKGLTVTSLEQNDATWQHIGIMMEQVDHIKVESCVTCYVGGYGMYINNTAGCDDILVYRCDSYCNADPLTSTGAYSKADGFTCNWGSAGLTTFRACRSWWNSDDGFDFLANSGTVFADSCWSFRNGRIPDTYTLSGSGGQGFKVGSFTTGTDTLRKYTNCISFDNTYGYNENNSTAQCRAELYNCVAYRNSSTGFTFKRNENPIKNCIAYDNPTNTNFSSFTALHSNDSWNTSGVEVSDADFLSVDTAGVTGARTSWDGLPSLNFLKLANISDMIDVGVDIGIAYIGDLPDIGYWETTPEVIPSSNTLMLELKGIVRIKYGGTETIKLSRK